MTERNQHINIAGQGHNLQIGDSNTQNVEQNFGGQPATVDEVFKAIDAGLDELPEADRERFKIEVVEPLREMAALPIAQQQQPTTLERARELAARLSPFAPKINKFLGAVAQSGLKLLAASHPVAGVLLAGVSAIQPESEDDAS